MFWRTERQRDESRPGGAPAADLRHELRDLTPRPFGRWRAAAVAGSMLTLAVGVAWVVGSLLPRLEGLEREVAVARAAKSEALHERTLVALELETLREVVEYSARYRVPADLARAIHGIALSEDLEPELAFRLVQTESSFRRHAVSDAGAIGYTQILPSTARWLDPTIRDEDLYDRDTNLRLGFRYLRLLLEENGGEMRLALLAYNRGPGTVRSIIARGGDPGNGYAARIMGSE